MKINKRILTFHIVFMAAMFALELLSVQAGYISWKELLYIVPGTTLVSFIILLPFHIAIDKKHKYPAEVLLVSLIFYPLGFFWAAKE